MTQQGFKFAETNVDNTPKKVKNVGKLEAYIVNFNDGEGKDQTRIVFRVPGHKESFILQERINGTNVATVAYDWFSSELAKEIEPVKKAVKSV